MQNNTPLHQVFKYYVALDALLDTRYGTLVSINELVIPELAKNRFWVRVSDEFNLYQSVVPQEEYLKKWNDRGNHPEILQYSLMTNMVLTLSKILLDNEKRFATRDFSAGKPEVYVNIFPHKLSEIGKERIIGALAHRLGFMTKIEIIDEDPLMITPTVMRYREYTVVIMYDYMPWFKKVMDQAIESGTVAGCPGIQFIVPQLVNSEAELKEAHMKLKQDPNLPNDYFVMLKASLVSIGAVQVKATEEFSVKLLRDDVRVEE